MTGSRGRAATADDNMALAESPHFLDMDGLRGVAAYAVIIFHVTGGEILPHSPLAVDFFFVLSGFVIAHAYADRLRQGMRRRDFAIKRAIRLYPMIILGTVFGTVSAIFRVLGGSSNAMPVTNIAVAGILGAFAIPMVANQPPGAEIFPLNDPEWSLFFELFANLIYVIIARYLRLPHVIAIAVLSGIMLVIFGSHGGNHVESFYVGFSRVTFGFFVGVLVYEFWTRNYLSRLRAPFAPLALLCLILMSLPRDLDWLVQLVDIPVFAAIVLASAYHRGTMRFARGKSILGALSYPLYILHWPIIYVGAVFGKKVLHLPPSADPVVHIMTVVAITIVAAVSSHYIDVPVRRALTKMFDRKSTTPPPAASQI
jgi:peptidoglycan/LPS O-acetylase OafA/YrhL